MNKEEIQISEQAKSFIKDNKKDLIEKLASLASFPPSETTPTTYFMSGSPGAGKTEFSIQILGLLPEEHIVRIDADEIKTHLPQYNKKNSDIVQGAASLGVEKLYDHVLHHNQNALLDGTLANYDKSKENVQRSLKKGRNIHIFYLYQDPLLAWDFTKKREKLEGRYIPRDAFIRTFFLARNTLKGLKTRFRKEISVHIVLKNSTNQVQDIHFNISAESIDSFVKISYDEDQLKKRLC